MIWTKTPLNFQLYVEEILKDCVLKIIKSVWSGMYSVEQYFFSVGRFFFTINIRAACAAKPTPSKLRRTLTFHSPTGHTSSHKQVKTPTHTCVKYALTENMYIQRITDTSQWDGRSNQQPRKDCTLQPIDYCTLITSVLVISERTNWLLVGGTKLYFPWNKYAG